MMHLYFRLNNRVYHLLVGLLLISALVLPFMVPGQAHAVSKTWDGGCGADTTWSCANNWSDNIVPVAADVVTFNSTSTNNSVVDSATFAGTIATININSGYTGTISLSRSLTVSTTFSQAAGTFTAGSQTLNLNVFTLSAGSFTASSGTTSASGNVTISGSPTFNANGGTFNFNRTTSGTSTLSCNNVTFNSVTFTNATGIESVSSNCSLPIGNNPSVGGITLAGTLSGTGTITTTGALTLNSGGVLSGFTGLSIGAGVTINGSYNFGSYTTFAVTSNAFTLNSGATFTAPSGVASFKGNFTINSGSTFNANGGTFNFNNTGSVTLACGSKTFNLVTLHNTGDITVSSDCSLPLGNNPVANSGGTIALSGTLSGTGTLTSSPSLNLSSGSSLSGFTGLVANSIGFGTGANYNFGSYTTFTITGGFSLSSGAVFTAPSGTASFANTFTINSGATFNANGGTVNFNGTASATLACGSKTFNLVTFTHTAGTKTVSSDCSLPLGNNPSSTSGGSITNNGTLSGSGTLTTAGTLTLGSGGSLSGFSGLATGALTINGTYNFSSYTSFTAGSTFILNSGAVFTAPSGIANFSRAFTINSGATFNANGGTVNFNGSGSVSIACNNATFNLVTFNNTSTRTVNSDCSLPLGNNPDTSSGGGNINLNGTFSGTGTLTTGGTFTLGSTGVLTGFSGLSASNITIAGTSNFGSYSTFTVAGGFTLNSGAVFTAPTGTASFAASFTINSGATFNANGGTVNFSGGTGTLACNNAIFNLVTFTNTGTKTINSDCSLPLGNNPSLDASGLLVVFGTLSGSGTLFDGVNYTTGGLNFRDGASLSGFTGLQTGAGFTMQPTSSLTMNFSNYTTFVIGKGFNVVGTGSTFIAPSGTAYVGGNLSLGSGDVFNANGGTMVLNGTGQTITGDFTFYNLTKTVTSDDTLTFAAGSTTTVAGTLTLHGGSGAYLSLASGTPGSPWYIDAQGTTNVYSVDVSDSHVLGTSITACTSIDDGGNAGWVFNPASCNPDHGGSGANTAIANYQILQSYLASQAAQSSQNNAAAANQFNTGSGLPSKIYEFLRQFPGGKAIINAFGDFVKALFAGLIIGILLGLFIVWRHRRQEEEAMEEYLAVVPPAAAIVTPPPSVTSAPPAETPAPGTTVQPSDSTKDPTDTTNNGGQP